MHKHPMQQDISIVWKSRCLIPPMKYFVRLLDAERQVFDKTPLSTSTYHHNRCNQPHAPPLHTSLSLHSVCDFLRCTCNRLLEKFSWIIFTMKALFIALIASNRKWVCFRAISDRHQWIPWFCNIPCVTCKELAHHHNFVQLSPWSRSWQWK